MFMIPLITALMLVGLAVLAVLAIHYANPSHRGQAGEVYVSRRLEYAKDGGRYIINDYLVDHADGSMQIDHIVINANGVFVIETKNYSGRIYGSDTSPYWTQYLAHGKTKNSFYNPVKQNEGHIRKLASVLGRRDIYHNVVVFLSQELRVESSHVVRLRDMEAYLQAPSHVHLTADEIEDIYHRLLAYKAAHPITKDAHVNRIAVARECIDRHICPRCRKDLVLRNGRYGRFWGCSGYPSCRFTKNIDDEMPPTP